MSDTPIDQSLRARRIKDARLPFDRLGLKLDRPLDSVPPNTEVRVSLHVPNNRIGQYLGLCWIASRRMTVAEARGEIGRALFTQFLDLTMPMEE